MRIRPIELRDAAATAALLNTIIATGVETSMSEPLTPEDQHDYIATAGHFPGRGDRTKRANCGDAEH